MRADLRRLAVRGCAALAALCTGAVLAQERTPVVPGAHDTAFPLGGNVQAGHLAYLQRPEFYRMLAAKVEVHARATPRS